VALPRSFVAVQELTQELREAVALKAKDRASGLLEQLERQWLRTNREQLAWSAQGKSMDVSIAFADALNEANEVKGQALVLTTGLVARF
jgi:hypothetical protein